MAAWMKREKDVGQTESVQQIVLTTEQLQAILASTKLNKDEQLELINAQANATAEANRRLLKPENSVHPGISVYSRPGGEQANPKGELKCRITWAGYPLDKDTLTPEEFDLVNLVVPGDYRCTKPDGSIFPVKVSGTISASTGRTESLDIFFATRGQLRHGLPSMVSMCRELIAQAPKPPVKVV